MNFAIYIPGVRKGISFRKYKKNEWYAYLKKKK